MYSLEKKRCEYCNCKSLRRLCIDCHPRTDKVHPLEDYQVDRWFKSTPQQKLHLHDRKRLAKLAKEKGIRNLHKYNRAELIEVLKPTIKEEDFPIRFRVAQF